MKNAHGVEPTRYMKRKESDCAIECNPKYGPRFGDNWAYDISIGDKCNKENSCRIENDGKKGYGCHPQYKSSLFVDTDGPDEENRFTVLDYEVFGIDYENKYIIDQLCKYPDIIWEYIETKDISEELLRHLNDDVELLADLDAIHCKDSAIRVKISQYSLSSPSVLFANSQIVDKKYDSYFKEWLGNDYQWKLIFRASEHGYTAESFHECSDNVKGPTLVIIKSSEGWIFGGYTTRSWSGDGIYYEINIYSQ